MITTSDKILVTGATGFLGAYILKALLEAGYKNIYALRRASSKMDLVSGFREDIKWVEADILDIMDLEEVVKEVDCIIHGAAVISLDPKDRSWMYQVNVNGTENLVNLSLEHGLKKFIHVSSIAALGRNENDTTIDEDIKWEDNELNSHYGISKYRAEMEVWRAASEGLNMAIINPSLILGAGYWDDGTPAIFKRVSKKVPFYPSGSTGIVDVRDVASAAIKLLESDISNERFIISGENFSYKEMICSISSSLGVKEPQRSLPNYLKGLAWRGEWLLSKLFNRPPMITKETIKTMSHHSRYENKKSIDLLEMNYNPVKDLIAETASIYKASDKKWNLF